MFENKENSNEALHPEIEGLVGPNTSEEEKKKLSDALKLRDQVAEALKKDTSNEALHPEIEGLVGPDTSEEEKKKLSDALKLRDQVAKTLGIYD